MVEKLDVSSKFKKEFPQSDPKLTYYRLALLYIKFTAFCMVIIAHN